MFLFNVFSLRLLPFNSRIVLRRRHGVAFSMSSALCATPLTKPPRSLKPYRHGKIPCMLSHCVMVPAHSPCPISNAASLFQFQTTSLSQATSRKAGLQIERTGDEERYRLSLRMSLALTHHETASSSMFIVSLVMGG